jgi:hypothetical protein
MKTSSRFFQVYPNDIYPLLPHQSSVSSEQFFSVARGVFDYRRSRLSPELAEKSVILNQTLPVVNFRY